MHSCSRGNCTPLSIAVDARNLARDHRGLGRYARALLRRFVHEEGVAITLVVSPPGAWLKKRALAKVLGNGRFAVAARIPPSCGLVWHPWNGIFLNGGRTHVCTIADLAPFHFPAQDPTRRMREQAPFITAAARANRIITFSHAAKRDITSLLGVPADSVSVTYLGVDDAFSPGAPALPAELRDRPYFFFVGDPGEQRKNFELLYRAFRRAWPSGDGPLLAVLSRADPRLARIVHLKLDTEDVEGKVNTRLRSLYRGAMATVVPSLYEGFGMPVIESMACGTPVIAARASSLPEISGEAALLEDPHDQTAWGRALKRVAGDPSLRAALSDLGRRNALGFRWETCARQTQSVFEEIADFARSMP